MAERILKPVSDEEDHMSEWHNLQTCTYYSFRSARQQAESPSGQWKGSGKHTGVLGQRGDRVACTRWCVFHHGLGTNNNWVKMILCVESDDKSCPHCYLVPLVGWSAERLCNRLPIICKGKKKMPQLLVLVFQRLKCEDFLFWLLLYDNKVKHLRLGLFKVSFLKTKVTLDSRNLWWDMDIDQKRNWSNNKLNQLIFKIIPG